MTPYEEIVALTLQAQQAIADRNYDSALAAYSQSLKLAQSLNRPQLIAVLFERRGKALEAQGDVQQAVIAYESALQSLAPEASDEVDEMISRLSRVGKGFYTSPEPIPDLYSPKAAESLAAAEADPAFEIKLWLSVGNAYFRQPQEKPALNAYQAVLACDQIETQPLLKAYAKANIGEIYRRQDKLDAAEAELTEALALFDAQGEPLEKRRALALLGGIACDRKQPAQAIKLYTQAIALYEQAKDFKGLARTLAGLARLHLVQKDFSTAEPLYQQTLDLAQSNNDEETLWHAYWGLGCCQYERGAILGTKGGPAIAAAIKSFEASIPLIDKRQDGLQTDEGQVTFLDSVKDVFDQLLSAHLALAKLQENPDFSAALAVAEKARGRSLEDLMDGRNRRRHPVASGNDDSGGSEVAMANQPFAGNRMMEQRAASTPVETMSFSPMEQRAIGTFLDPVAPGIATSADAEALPSEREPVNAPPLARLVFYVLLDKTAIFAVDPSGGIKGHVANIGCHELEERVANLRRALRVDGASRAVSQAIEQASEPASEQTGEHSTDRKASVVDGVMPRQTTATDLDQLLQTFYAGLIAPVAEALPTDRQPLVIEPHSALWLLPFAALKTSDGVWMGDQWPLLYAPSLQTLEEIRQEPCYAELSDSKAVVVGNPVMPTVPTTSGVQLTLGNLPGAEKEAKAIGAVLKDYETQLLIGDEATEARVKELSKTHNVVHLATHGIAYMGDPLASFVAFSPTETENGLLTAREVATDRSLPLDLVVLSACQTGLGKVSGDGMLGLSRAFLIAGARTVVVSQWSVDDAATAALMVEFYREYIRHGQKAIALQTAMASVRSTPDYRHPRYWSAFMVVGAET